MWRQSEIYLVNVHIDDWVDKYLHNEDISQKKQPTH